MSMTAVRLGSRIGLFGSAIAGVGTSGPATTGAGTGIVASGGAIADGMTCPGAAARPHIVSKAAVMLTPDSNHRVISVVGSENLIFSRK
jgi:hypothetical protein